MREADNHPSMRDVGWLLGVIALTVDAEGSRSRNRYAHHPNQPQLSRVSYICVLPRIEYRNQLPHHSFFRIAMYVVYLSISTADFHPYSSGPVRPRNPSQPSSASCKHASLTWYKAEDQLPPKCKCKTKMQNATKQTRDTPMLNAHCALRVSFLYIYQLSSYARCFKYATRKFAKTFRSLEVVIERIMSEPSKPMDGKKDCCRCSMKSIPVLL